MRTATPWEKQRQTGWSLEQQLFSSREEGSRKDTAALLVWGQLGGQVKDAGTQRVSSGRSRPGLSEIADCAQHSFKFMKKLMCDKSVTENVAHFLRKAQS